MNFQQKIQDQAMANYEDANNAALSRIAKLTLANVFPYAESELVGPYTTHTTYFYPHGEDVAVVTRSKLTWDFLEVIKL